MGSPSKPRVCVLGLGIMGIAMAENLHQDGYLSGTWNRTPKPEVPEFSPDMEDAIQECDFILILVTDDDAVSAVIDQLLPIINNQHLVIQCSTVHPESNIKFNERVEKTGAHFIESLIGGSKAAAINRKIIFYTGGDQAQYQRAVPALETISAGNIYIGPVGKASVVKLAMNLNIALQIEALCESFAYAESAGIDAETYFTVLKNNTAWNRLTDYKEQNLRNKEFQPAFSIRNMLKDIRLALETDRTRNGLTLLGDVEKIYALADKKGMGDEDMIALYKLLNQ